MISVEGAPAEVALMVEAKPWERLEGEPARWHDRFVRYFLLVGDGRSLLDAERRFASERAAIQQRQAKPKTGNNRLWREAADTWRWRERAAAFDAAEHKRLEEARAQEVDKLFESINGSARALYAKMTHRIMALKPEQLRPDQVIPQFLALANYLEKMYGRSPAQKVELSGPNGGPLQIDVNEQRAALQRLEAYKRAHPQFNLV